MSAAAAAQLGAGGAGAAGSGGGGAGVAEGPGLARGAGEDALVSSLNEWGRRVDASLGLLMSSFSDLRGEVFGTQAVLATTIQEAKVALNVMHEGFRQALDVNGAQQRFDVEALIVQLLTEEYSVMSPGKGGGWGVRGVGLAVA